MSVKEQFYNQRPAVLFDPRASQRIDPRFKFTRDGAASYTDRDGVLQVNGAPANQPRVGFNYEPDSDGVLQLVQGITVEEQRTNLITNNTMVGAVAGTPGTLPTNWSGSLAGPGLTSSIQSVAIVNGVAVIDYQVIGTTSQSIVQLFTVGGSNTVAASGQFWSFSGYFALVSGSFANVDLDLALRENDSGFVFLRQTFESLKSATSSLSRKVVSARLGGSTARITPALRMFVVAGRDVNFTLRIGLPQLEQGPAATSPIPTATTAVTRPADLLSFNTEVPSSGSLYIDAEAFDASVDNTLLSAANASDEKLLLQVQQPANLFNGTALVYSIDESFEPTLPFPIPEPGAQRNIVTWGANNFHYQQSNYRKTPSLTASVPENMNRIGIGHDITDPTKGFNGVISRLYLWANELPPEIARGLVRGNITVPFDTDDGNIIPTDAQVFVFNTQGTTFTGDKVVRFQLLGSNNSVSINWGDGITETYAGSAANTTITHTYETAGLYLVSITGVFENLKLGNFTGSQASDLASVLQNSPDWSPTNLADLYNGCSLITSDSLDDFPDTSLVTQFAGAFRGCSSLTSFPLINTSAGTSFSSTWRDCISLTSFPLIDTAAGISFTAGWENCSSLTSFPLINTSAGTGFSTAWRGCSSLTSFPLINTSAGTNFLEAWENCSNLTSFPLINTSAGTSFSSTWRDCISLTSFPLIDTAAGKSFLQAWLSCVSLTSFPLINTSAGTNFYRSWRGCISLTAFPALNFDAAVGLASASSGSTGLAEAWFNCSALADFPPNLFDNTTCTNYFDAFTGCALTATSIENILVSINTANTSNGNLSLQGGTNAVKTSWTANANTAYDALVARGWTITFRP
jgi:hypothetical protein